MVRTAALTRRLWRLVAMLLVPVVALIPAGQPRQSISASASGTENANDPTWLLPYIYPTTQAIALSSDATARYVFTGAGYGHGVGMSQWGARGRALDGQDAFTILSAYYRGATAGPVPGSANRVRVRILHDSRPAAGDHIDVLAGPVTVPGTTQPLTAGAYIAFKQLPDGYHIHAVSTAGVQLAETTLAGGFSLGGSDSSLLRVQFKTADPVAGATGSTYNVYRGSLNVLPSPQGLDVMNDVTLDQYLYSVVPSEMPAGWPMAALRAQAIAARTFAVHERQGATATWDVDDTTAYQRYLGALREQFPTTLAVQSTTGTILLSDGKPIQAYYHACNAGYAEDGESVFPDAAASYLRGFRDADGSGLAYDRDCPRGVWKIAGVTTTDIEQALDPVTQARIGQIRWIDLSTRAASGRVIQVVVGGSLGIDSVPAQTFRLRYNRNHPQLVDELLSTGFDLTRAIP